MSMVLKSISGIRTIQRILNHDLAYDKYKLLFVWHYDAVAKGRFWLGSWDISFLQNSIFKRFWGKTLFSNHLSFASECVFRLGFHLCKKWCTSDK